MMHGFINVLKPAGMTSHDVVSFIRRIVRLKRVGHTGTLDPGAVGVLPVAVGLATRLVEYVTGQKKAYRAEITLGTATDSGDAFGNIINSTPDVNVTKRDIEIILAKFVGVINQTPPMTSAIKVEGKKLYELARLGIEVVRPVRKVEIYSINAVKWDLSAIRPRLLMDVECSKGTYIRSLCHDIGHALGCGAYMSFLVRIGVGDFWLDNALTLEELQLYAEKGILHEKLISMEQALPDLPRLDLDEEQACKIGHGQVILTDFTSPPLSTDIQLMHNGNLLAIGKATKELHSEKYIIKPLKVFQR
jgi:tRNA pseudouridine55 synthase